MAQNGPYTLEQAKEVFSQWQVAQAQAQKNFSDLHEKFEQIPKNPANNVQVQAMLQQRNLAYAQLQEANKAVANWTSLYQQALKAAQPAPNPIPAKANPNFNGNMLDHLSTMIGKFAPQPSSAVVQPAPPPVSQSFSAVAPAPAAPVIKVATAAQTQAAAARKEVFNEMRGPLEKSVKDANANIGVLIERQQQSLIKSSNVIGSALNFSYSQARGAVANIGNAFSSKENTRVKQQEFLIKSMEKIMNHNGLTAEQKYTAVRVVLDNIKSEINEPKSKLQQKCDNQLKSLDGIYKPTAEQKEKITDQLKNLNIEVKRPSTQKPSEWDKPHIDPKKLR